MNCYEIDEASYPEDDRLLSRPKANGKSEHMANRLLVYKTTGMGTSYEQCLRMQAESEERSVRDRITRSFSQCGYTEEKFSNLMFQWRQPVNVPARFRPVLSQLTTQIRNHICASSLS